MRFADAQGALNPEGVGRESRRTSLESRRDPTLAQLADPMLALESLKGLVVLDEIQRVPDLFPVLRVLADRPGRPATFLVLGSASPDLLRQSSESLAGRIHYHEIDGFRLNETGVEGTSVLIKSDPHGFVTRNVASQAVTPMGGNLIPPFSLPGITFDANVDFNIGPLAPLPGTYVAVPLPPADGGRVAIGGGGGPFESSRAGLPYWVVRGSMNKDRFTAGETLEVTATIAIASPLVSAIEKTRANDHAP